MKSGTASAEDLEKAEERLIKAQEDMEHKLYEKE